MFGHSAWMARMMKGCFVDDGGVNGGGGPEPENTDTDNTDPFDSLDLGLDEEDEEPEGDPEAKPDPEKGDPDKDAGQDEEKPVRTSKQDPEFDALAARTRRAEEELSRMRQQQEALILEQQRKQQTQPTVYDQMWGNVQQLAEEMRKAGYDELYVSSYVESERRNIILQQELDGLKQNMAQTARQNQQITQHQESVQAVKGFFSDMKKLKEQYGDLVPDLAGVSEDINGFYQYVEKLPPEMVQRLQRGYEPIDAFITVNHGKLATREKSLIEKRTVANIQDRSKRTVETNKAEPKPEEILTKRELSLAKAFGVPPAEVAKRTNPKLKKGVS
jgi:hypothetical protein